MKSLYRQLKGLESAKYRRSCRYARRGNVTKYQENEKEYDDREAAVIEEYKERLPIFKNMDSNSFSFYLEKKQKEYETPTLMFTESDRKKKELNREFKDVLGMWPLPPSYISISWLQDISIAIGSRRKKKSRERLEFISKVSDKMYPHF